MITELLGQRESEHLGNAILAHVKRHGLQGKLLLNVPFGLDKNAVADDAVERLLQSIDGPGTGEIEITEGLRLRYDLILEDGRSLPAASWYLEMFARKPQDSRLFAEATASHGMAANPIELQMVGPRRTGSELLEYLWERKFRKAAEQCSGTRGGVLVLGWEGVTDPSVFQESDGMQALLARTFDEYRHIAAIVMRCDSEPNQIGGALDYETKAYLARSGCTNFPEVASLMKLDRVSSAP